MAETVTIKINVKADTAAIERLRAQLKSLCREVDDCTKTHEKHAKTLRDMSKAHRDAGRDVDKTRKSIDDYGRSTSRTRQKTNVFWKEFLDFSKFPGQMLGALSSLAKMGFKYVAIEAALAAATLATATLLFKTGSFFAKSYQAALSGVAYGFAAVAAAAAVFFAAQRQFQSVQFAPQYAEGAVNTSDRFMAASGAMKMFVDDARMAVLGAEALSGAFKTLSDQAPVTGQTTATFRALSNYTTGIGGDLKKSSAALADFMAKFQKDKTMSAGVKAAGEKLGPDFKKILDEANKLGVSTYEEFSQAAIQGQLGDTFAKYAGQLDAVNGTLLAQLKQAGTQIKSLFTELGEPLLGPTTEALRKIVRSVEVLFIRMRADVQSFGGTDLLETLVDLFERAAYWLGDILTNKLSDASTHWQDIKDGFKSIGNFFEKLQDYFRPLQDAGQVILDVLGEIGGAFFGNFTSTLEQFGTLLVDNREGIMDFAKGVAGFIKEFGKLGTVIKEAIVGVLPLITALIKAVTKGLSIIVSGLNMIMKLGKVIGGFLTLAAVGMGMRALKAAKMAMDNSMKNLYAKVVNVYGPGSSPQPSHRYTDKDRGPRGTFRERHPKTGKMFDVMSRMGYGSMALAAGGQMLQSAGGNNGLLNATGGIAKTAGMAMMAANMFGPETIKGVSTLPVVGMGAAGAAGAYYAGKGLSEKFFKDDSVASRLGGAGVGALGGAASGALAGAGIGMMFGGPAGAAIGAGVGAIGGAIIGGLSGYFGAGKERKNLRKAANKLVEGYDSAVMEAIKDGNLDALKKAQEDAASEIQAMQDKGGYSATAIANKQQEIADIDKKVENFSRNAQIFADFVGKDTDQLNAYMKSIGKDASKDIVNLFGLILDGSTGAREHINMMMSDFNGKLIEARLNIFDLPMKFTETQKAVDAAQQKLLGGDTSRESIIEFLKSDFMYALSLTGGNALKAAALQEKSLREAAGPGGELSAVGEQINTIAEEIGVYVSGTDKLLQQVIQTGQLEYMGNLVSELAKQRGLDISSADMQLMLGQKFGQSAEAAAIVDQAFTDLLGGKIGVMDFLGGVTGGARDFYNLGELSKNVNTPGSQRFVDEKGGGMSIPQAEYKNISVGGVTVQVNGILDDNMARKIAEAVMSVQGKYAERIGGRGYAPGGLVRR